MYFNCNTKNAQIKSGGLIFQFFVGTINSMQKKRGAPRKLPEKAKSEMVQLRLSSAEKQAFALAAELDGKKISEWIRDRLRRVSRQEIETAGLPVPFLAGIVKE
jgi:predicted HicB family RNase H-like nuclease